MILKESEMSDEMQETLGNTTYQQTDQSYIVFHFVYIFFFLHMFGTYRKNSIIWDTSRIVMVGKLDEQTTFCGFNFALLLKLCKWLLFMKNVKQIYN